MIKFKKIVVVLSILIVCFDLQASNQKNGKVGRKLKYRIKTDSEFKKAFQVDKDFMNASQNNDIEGVKTTIKSFEGLFRVTSCIDTCYSTFINQQDKDGKTALCHAVNYNNLSMSCLLLQLGAKSDNSLVSVAQSNQNSDLVGILIDANVDVINQSKKRKER